MPELIINKSTASGASGDAVISITPQSANDLLLVGLSEFNSGTLSGWNRVGNYGSYQESTGTSPVTFDLPSASLDPGPGWSALMLDLPSVAGSPVFDQTILIDFGSFPENSYTHTLSGLNAGDCIIMSFCGAFDGIPSCGVSDSQGNSYTTVSNVQLVNGKYHVVFFVMAFDVSAGSDTVTMTFNTTQVSGQYFAIDLNTFSGIAPPPPVIPPIPTQFFYFQDPSGKPIANGTLSLQLQQDISAATTGGPQIAAGRVVNIPIDSNGIAIVKVWQNSSLQPSAVYRAKVYTAKGQPVWEGNLTITASGSKYILLENGSLILLESGAPNGILLENQ